MSLKYNDSIHLEMFFEISEHLWIAATDSYEHVYFFAIKESSVYFLDEEEEKLDSEAFLKVRLRVGVLLKRYFFILPL